MNKKVQILICLFVVLVQLVGCGKLSDKELQEASHKYEKSLQALCDEYGLTDASIEVGNTFGTRNEKNKIYIESATVTSDMFSELTGEKAFAFAKEFDGLDDICFEDNNDIHISFIAYIISNENRFEYESEKGFEYLMYEYNNSVVTYKDDKLMYNIFDNKEYENVDFDDSTTDSNASSEIYNEVTDSDTKISILICAEDVVSSNLKSPSSAKFCNTSDAKVYSNGGEDYTVIGFVDADNAFGANIRTNFIVTLTYTGEGYKNGSVIFE